MEAVRSFTLLAMGTECAFHLYCDDPEVTQAAIDEVLRIEHQFSRYRPDSIVSEINRTAARGGTILLDAETARLIDYAFACRAKSGGLFDITTGILRRVWDFSVARLPAAADVERLLPLIGMDKLRWESPALSFLVAGMELDLGGIGKEYAADRVAAVCMEAGVRHGLADLGGDLRVIGPRPDGEPWKVHLRNPRSIRDALAVVSLEQGGLATSGDYERFIEVGGQRYCHILNPTTGWPVRGMQSASVAADTCLVAGSLSTIAMLKGRSGAEWLRRMGVRHLCVDADGKAEGDLCS
jgi:thiamine biosynthesis lipoprotein